MNHLAVLLLLFQPAGLVVWEKPIFYGMENVYMGEGWILAGPAKAVYLLNGETGEESWRFRTKHPLTDLYASGDKVVVTTEKGIHVLGLSTGEPLWETITLLPGTKHAFPVTGSVVINDSMIALHSMVEAYNLSNGASPWNRSFIRASSPTISLPRG